jgi:hypothetical protein
MIRITLLSAHDGQECRVGQPVEEGAGSTQSKSMYRARLARENEHLQCKTSYTYNLIRRTK